MSTQSRHSVPFFPGPHLCRASSELSHHLSLISTPSPFASKLKYFLSQGLRTTTPPLGFPSLHIVTLSRSESLSHIPSLHTLWSSDLPPPPGSLGQPTARLHCIRGVLPPLGFWVLLCPDFAKCFLLEHKCYEYRDLPSGLSHLISTPSTGNSRGDWCTAGHQTACIVPGLYKASAVFWNVYMKRGTFSWVALAPTAC